MGVRLAAAALALAFALPAQLPAEVNIRSKVDLDLEELARCLDQSGARFYGAHWCPVCRKQMAYFGDSAASLPYVECYDGSRSEGINAECREESIRSFPTWVFPNGRVKSGALQPVALAAASGCLDL